MRLRAAAICALIAAGLLLAVRHSAKRQEVRLAVPAGLARGDVVLFRTTTWRGQLVRALQRDGNFAHAGILVQGGGDARVAHACPTQPAVVKIERLADLLRRDEITSAAYYRPRVSPDAAARAAAIAREYARRATPFDFEFDLSTDRAVYCTELIWLAYRSAGLRLATRGRIIFPADLVRTGFLAPLSPPP